MWQSCRNVGKVVVSLLHSSNSWGVFDTVAQDWRNLIGFNQKIQHILQPSGGRSPDTNAFFPWKPHFRDCPRGLQHESPSETGSNRLVLADGCGLRRSEP